MGPTVNFQALLVFTYLDFEIKQCRKFLIFALRRYIFMSKMYDWLHKLRWLAHSAHDHVIEEKPEGHYKLQFRCIQTKTRENVLKIVQRLEVSKYIAPISTKASFSSWTLYT